MRYAIGIDLGGTNVKIISVSDRGRIIRRDRFATHDDFSNRWARAVLKQIRSIENKHGKAQWIGLACPGLAAPNGSGIIWMQGRMAGLEGFDWARHLRRPRVPVLSDAHAALLGEIWKGAAKNARNAVLLTLGTGVGGAILADGRLLKGHIGRAGHLGHISLDIDGPPDIVRTPGSLEDAIGEMTLAHRCNGRFKSTRELVQAHLGGDGLASSVWLRSVRVLAAAVVSYINAVDPEIVIIGGGIAKAGPALFDPLTHYLDMYEWRPHGHRVKIVPAKLGDEAGALGAAWNAIHYDPKS